jgi:hypothetical protein
MGRQKRKTYNALYTKREACAVVLINVEGADEEPLVAALRTCGSDVLAVRRV